MDEALTARLAMDTEWFLNIIEDSFGIYETECASATKNIFNLKRKLYIYIYNLSEVHIMHLDDVLRNALFYQYIIFSCTLWYW